MRYHNRTCLHAALILSWILLGACGHEGAEQPHPPPNVKSPAGTRSNSKVDARFVDVSDSVGIHYRWEIPGKRPLTILQTIGNGCAFLDYNGDGNLDVLLIGPKLALYRGDGKGHFTDVTRDAGLDQLTGQFLGCAVGDYDNDGWPDLYISGYRTGRLLHNEHGRGFRDVTAQAGLKAQPWGTSCSFGDIDGDGRLDLYIGDYLAFGPQTVPQLCDTNGHLTACSPLFYQREIGALYRNLGGGRFKDVTREWGCNAVSGKALGVAFVPLEDPPRLALSIANDEETGDLLVRRGGHFENVGSRVGVAYGADGKPMGGMGIDWGDYNNDGSLDAAVATFEEEVKPIFENDGGHFTDRSQALGAADAAWLSVSFGIKWLDFDNDGWLDLMITNGHISDNVADFNSARRYRQPSLLLHNLGGTRFEEIGGRTGNDISRPIVGRGLAIGDYDNDGRLDVLLVDSEGAPILLHNETEPAGRWILVKLIGTKCNRDGFGALVTAEVGGRRLTRHCHTDGSYLSASDSRVHFGLGTAATATISVRWPDGHVDRYPNLPSDRQITIQEGAKTVQ